MNGQELFLKLCFLIGFCWLSVVDKGKLEKAHCTKVQEFSLMMAITHAAIATAGTSLILGTANPLTLGLAILGSQLPDIDTTTSAIGQICYPISNWIENRFPHRTVTHCLIATAVLTIASVAVGWKLGYLMQAIALPLGHLLACFSDTFTKQGVQLFYPYPAWAVSVSNPRRRLKTGGAGELWVLALAIALLITGVYLATGGGITQQVSQTLGLKDGQVDLYNEKAANHQMVAAIQGVWASDRRKADGKYTIIAAEGSEFVITDGKGLYRTNEQIIPARLVVEAGKPATTVTRSLVFEDQTPTATLQALKVAYPGAAIYLSGELVCDAVDLLKVVPAPDKLATLTKTEGGTIKLSYLLIEQAITLLRDQYATGTLVAKIIRPAPVGASKLQ
jgi:inner membrane protein